MSQYFTLANGLDEALAAAAAAIADGACVVLPTDTVYGIAADPFAAEAVAALLAAKQRGDDMPPPVLLAQPAMLRAVAAKVPEPALALAAEFWPGPLTLVLKAHKANRMHLGQTNDTLALRVPDCEPTRALLRLTGPLAVSSANISGQAAATTCERAREQLGDDVEVYLDGGATQGETPSTIVDFTRSNHGTVLRPGALEIDELRRVAPDLS